jgi:bifunctional DNase/RNase
MQKIELKIFGLSYSHSQSSAYALILGEKNGNRRLPIIVGGLEAQAIAIEVEKMKPARPLTHDLFKAFADIYRVEVKEIIINKFIEGIFYSVLVCDNGHQEVEIDSRTSDAVAIALRFNCPIYTYEQVMSVAGVIMDVEEELNAGEVEESEYNEFGNFNLSELQDELNRAVENEEYERASIIRDEMNKRSK